MSSLSAATRLDLLRRPSTRLALVAAGALVALVPHLPAPGASARDQMRLTLELGTTSIVLIVQMFAGTAAVYSASAEADRGITPELAASPYSRPRIVFQRWGGVVQASSLALLILCGVAAVAWTLAGIPLTQLSGMVPAAMSGAAGAAAFAGFGLLVGGRLRADAATLLVVIAPWLAPMLGALNAPPAVVTMLGSILPPATGPIHPRPAAFGHPATPVADLLSVVATLTQAVAWCTLAGAGFAGARKRAATTS